VDREVVVSERGGSVGDKRVLRRREAMEGRMPKRTKSWW